jgi:LmbE family N-acetylglucosaminyl deacetylase
MIPAKTLTELQNSVRPTDLARITIPSDLRLLVLAPHPDDFDEIAVSLKHFQSLGVEIGLLVLTGASSGVLDSFANPPTKESKQAIREREQRAALDFFCLPQKSAEFLYLPEDQHGELVLTPSTQETIAIRFKSFSPDIVTLPYGYDTNSGHQRTFLLLREIGISSKKPLLALYQKDPKTISIQLEAYTAFDESIAAWKGEMLRFHQSQQTRNLAARNYGIDERILRMNQGIAQELGIQFPYAEGFQIELFGRSHNT